ncbi:MAG TPA: hypothetical protein VGJ26_08220, partial [Pirellulales bacterium]
MDDAPFILPTLPDAWRSAALAQLENGEVIHGWFETDLDESLHFVDGLVLLTDRRVLSSQTFERATGGAIDEVTWKSVRLTDAANLRPKERNGLGVLELLNSNGRLAVWRYTASRAASAHELAERFDSVRRGLPIDAIHLEDAQPEGGIATPPPPVSTWTLLRLGRFARPRAGLILL